MISHNKSSMFELSLILIHFIPCLTAPNVVGKQAPSGNRSKLMANVLCNNEHTDSTKSGISTPRDGQGGISTVLSKNDKPKMAEATYPSPEISNRRGLALTVRRTGAAKRKQQLESGLFANRKKVSRSSLRNSTDDYNDADGQGTADYDNEEDEDLSNQPTMVACRVEAMGSGEESGEGDSESIQYVEEGIAGEVAHEVEIENKSPQKNIDGMLRKFCDGIPEEEAASESIEDQNAARIASEQLSLLRRSQVIPGIIPVVKPEDPAFDPDDSFTGKFSGRNSAANVLFDPYRNSFQNLSFKDLVAAEVLYFRINQIIFSKAVLGRSQGYLSDLLNHQDAIMRMEEPTKMFSNFVKIKQFLDLPEEDRRQRYLDCVGQLDDEKKRNKEEVESGNYKKIKEKRKRTNFTKAVKDELTSIARERGVMPENWEIDRLAKKYELSTYCLKNFFRNFKQRSRIKADGESL